MGGPSFRISINAEHCATISLPSQGVLSCITGWDELPDASKFPRSAGYLNLGGLDTISNEHLEWERRDLKIGDVVEIELVEFVEAVPEAKKRLVESVDDVERKKEYVRSVVKELGWQLIESEE